MTTDLHAFVSKPSFTRRVAHVHAWWDPSRDSDFWFRRDIDLYATGLVLVGVGCPIYIPGIEEDWSVWHDSLVKKKIANDAKKADNAD